MSTFSKEANAMMGRILSDDPSLAVVGGKDCSQALKPEVKKTKEYHIGMARNGKDNPQYKYIPKEIVEEAIRITGTIKQAAINTGVSLDCFRNKMCEYGIRKGKKKNERKNVP